MSLPLVVVPTTILVTSCSSTQLVDLYRPIDSLEHEFTFEQFSQYKDELKKVYGENSLCQLIDDKFMIYIYNDDGKYDKTTVTLTPNSENKFKVEFTPTPPPPALGTQYLDKNDLAQYLESIIYPDGITSSY